MNAKKSVRLLVSALAVTLCTSFSALASFSPVHSVVFGPERNNYDDSFKDHGNKFHISYARENGVAQIIVKQHSKGYLYERSTVSRSLLYNGNTSNCK